MTKPKKPAPIALPKKGGSYVADAGTGKLERKAHTLSLIHISEPTRPY